MESLKKKILIKSSLFMFNLILVSPTLFFPGFCAIILLEKGALTPKSFAIIVRLSQITLIFKINSCPKTNLFQTEEWDVNKQAPMYMAWLVQPKNPRTRNLLMCLAYSCVFLIIKIKMSHNLYFWVIVQICFVIDSSAIPYYMYFAPTYLLN